MQLLLHIGLGKTGSSAIQSWLARNARKLRKQSVFYADLDPNAKLNKITSGNGTVLVNAYLKNNEDRQQKALEQCINTKCDLSIISTESFHRLKQNDLETLAEHCQQQSIAVSVIAYLRSAYEWAYSGYLQGVKRHGVIHKFDALPQFAMHHQLQVLENFNSAFNGKLTVKNYDCVRDDLIDNFAAFIGCDTSKLDMTNPPVNRSLSYAEAEAIRQVNELHDGALSFEISDHVIYTSPDKITKTPFVRQVYDLIKAQASENIATINTRYFNAIPDQAIQLCQLETTSNDTVGDVAPDFSGIIDWALSSKPLQGRKKRVYINFLRDFALLIEHSEPIAAKNIINKALSLRPEGIYINKIASRLAAQ